MPADIKLEIPHVWFDIIGRVIPGAFLIVGLGAEGCFPGIAAEFKHYMLGTTTTISVITFLGFIAAAFTVGFLLAPLGGLLDCLWDRCCPLRLDPKKFSPASIKILKDEFQVSDEDVKADQNKKISLARLTALHNLWTYPAALPIALLASKRDAEKLASGSLVGAGLLLMLFSCGIDSHERCAVRVLLLLVIAMSVCVHHHYRRRVVETSLDALAEIRRQHEERI